MMGFGDAVASAGPHAETGFCKIQCQNARCTEFINVNFNRSCSVKNSV